MPWAARGYLAEALLFLVLARVAVRYVPFRRLTAFLRPLPRRPEAAGPEREELRKGVRWTIDEAARYLPGETVCFPRAIAAQAMLRRRRVGTTLYYGANTEPDRGLTAHVWLQDGSVGVVGEGLAEGYHVLARYPETDPWGRPKVYPSPNPHFSGGSDEGREDHRGPSNRDEGSRHAASAAPVGRADLRAHRPA